MLKIDREKLCSLFRDFYLLTDVQICLFDEAFAEVLRYPEEPCLFCRTVRQNERINALCKACDRFAFKKCRETKSRYTYRCHMNLIESATPLLYENAIVGYIMIGQIADSGSNLDGIDFYSYQLQLAGTAVKADYNAIPHVSDEKIAAASHIADACAGYLYVSKLISLQGQSLAQTIDAYLKENIASEISVENLCRRFYLSRTELYHTFLTLFGSSVAGYIKAFRLDYAKELLLTSTLPVSTIAEKSGIGDYNYFSKVFKKRFGKSALQFRKNG